MSKRKAEKLLEKFSNRPISANISFNDADWLLQYHGFERRQSSGGSSHFIYFHPQLEKFLDPNHASEIGEEPYQITIPYKGKHLKKAYVKMVADAIEMKIDCLGRD